MQGRIQGGQGAFPPTKKYQNIGKGTHQDREKPKHGQEPDLPAHQNSAIEAGRFVVKFCRIAQIYLSSKPCPMFS